MTKQKPKPTRLATQSKHQFHIGSLVMHHYCGGSVYGEVVKVNEKSCLVKTRPMRNGERQEVVNYKKNELSHWDPSLGPKFEDPYEFDSVHGKNANK